ncbi:MAG: DinB family protein [Ignavibacteriae bacterium]|nr:DinB family protein [Ignavibacteriota bacterium]
MAKQTKWIDRTFDFNFPLGVFPCILERLRGTPARVEELVRSFQPGILIKRVSNSWSIQEHVGHLLDLDTLHDGRIDDYLAGATTLRPADITNKKTWEANHNAQSIEEILKSFRLVRMHVVHRLEALDEETLSRTAIHPRLQQPMRVLDMAYFVAEHDDHHIARMTQLANILKD